MKTVVFLVFCLVLGVMLKHEGIAALVLVPIGFVFGFYVTTQTIVLLVLGLPRAIRLVARGQMRATIIGRILLTPLIWLFALFAIGLLCGFFWPSAVDYLYNNAAFNWAGDLGFYGIIISMFFPGYRTAFRADFDARYQQFNIKGVPAPAQPGAAPATQPAEPTTQFPTVHESVLGNSRIPTPDEVRNLSPGTLFRGPDGKIWRAKGGVKKPAEGENATASAATSPPFAGAPAKLYSINPDTKTPVLSGAVKTPNDIASAYQQMVDDKVMTLAEARQHLINIGWQAPAKAQEPPLKLYTVDPKTQRVMFSPSIKTPDDQLNAVQQMLKDHVITPQRARATLLSLGFTPKQPPPAQ